MFLVEPQGCSAQLWGHSKGLVPRVEGGGGEQALCVLEGNKRTFDPSMTQQPLRSGSS